MYVPALEHVAWRHWKSPVLIWRRHRCCSSQRWCAWLPNPSHVPLHEGISTSFQPHLSVPEGIDFGTFVSSCFLCPIRRFVEFSLPILSCLEGIFQKNFIEKQKETKKIGSFNSFTTSASAFSKTPASYVSSSLTTRVSLLKSAADVVKCTDVDYATGSFCSCLLYTSDAADE